nr:hypothetical protein [uncultured Desulfobulbus sp.]
MKRPLLVTALFISIGFVVALFFYEVSRGKIRWKEEVLLHDGNTLIVERLVDLGGRHEIGQSPAYKYQSLKFFMPGTKEKVLWEDEFSKDLGMINFLPLLLDVFKETPFLIVTPMGCLSYNKWVRPNPPYIIFRYENKKWVQIPLHDLPSGIEKPNLIHSRPDFFAERNKSRFFSAEAVKGIVSGYHKQEHKKILRKAIPNYGEYCGEMIRDGKNGWIGIGWFRKQTSYEDCQKMCERNTMEKEYCPCDELFKTTTENNER